MTKRLRDGVVAEAFFVVIPAALAITYWVVTFGS